MPPTRRPLGLTGYAYLGGIASLAAYWLDERLDLRKWKKVNYQVQRSSNHSNGAAPLHVAVDARRRPPPIGGMEWPSGRFLLQWALDDGRLADREHGSSATVLEIGSGIGIASIGLALARKHELSSLASSGAPDAHGAQPRKAGLVLATDFCDETLAILQRNTAGAGLGDDEIRVAKWDAAAGEAALASLPVPLSKLTHVIGADVVYHGFGSETDASGRGLEHTLKALLEAKPDLRVTLFVSDRFSGGAVAALSDAAGVNQTSEAATTDPAVAQFLRSCHGLGLKVTRTPLPPDVISTVSASQWPIARAYWWLAGFYDGISVCEVSLQAASRS